MRIYFADIPDGHAAWLRLWERSDGREVFAHPGYAGLWADDRTRACAAVYESNGARVLYPFLLRDITKEPFGRPVAGPAFDVISPYGYGGPAAVWPRGSAVPSDGEKEKLYKGFYAAFHAWAAENHVVSEFVRFSLFSEARPWYDGHVAHHNDNIVARLDVPAEELWRGFRHKVRKNVRTAREHGLRVVADERGERLEDFLKVYHDTMKRRRASQAYFFSSGFFRGLLEGVPGGAVFFHVLSDGQVVASELVLCARGRVYSFLGGTLRNFYPMRPGDLLKVHIMEWAREKGFREFVIGGGYRPHDGIFAFKRAFAPDGIVPFFVGKRVFDPEKYRRLCEAAGRPAGGAVGESAGKSVARFALGAADVSAGELYGEGFFPAYRG
jgi:CelD/BcsL family acetyltransferase involved in cellulose biosynthesis